MWGWETHHTLPSRICVRVEAERDTATPTGAAAGALARRETARRSMTASRPARREVPRARARAHPNTANAHLEIRAERTNPRPAGFRVLAVEPTGIRESAQPPRAEWSGEVFSLSHSPSPLQTTTTVTLRVSFASARVAALSVSLSLYALTPSCRSTTGLSSGAAGCVEPGQKRGGVLAEVRTQVSVLLLRPLPLPLLPTSAFNRLSTSTSPYIARTSVAPDMSSAAA